MSATGVRRLLDQSTTAAIVLGASNWTQAGLGLAPSFRRSAKALLRYLIDSAGLGLDTDLVIDLFDDPTSAGEQLARLRDNLDGLLRERRDIGQPVEDVLVYYIGHGHTDDQGHLSLLVRQSRQALEAETGIKAPDLAAAGQGSADAQRNLGLCYANGRGGLARDEREAARLYRLAADQGNADAQHNLALCYANGRLGLPKDEQEAARLYRLAAEQGNANAQTCFGAFFENGQGGLTRDEREAARLYRLAADQGNAYAQYNLGVFFANGRGGVAEDKREAARFYRLAADQSHAGALAALAAMD